MSEQNPIIEREDRHASGVYSKRPMSIVRGSGAALWDEAGRSYIDLTAGIGVANIGHSHPALVEALTAQASTLITCPEMFYNDRRADLLERLAGILPGGMDRVYLCNSGAEAVEAALKFARLSTGRTEIVAAMRGFHGRTMGALSATHNKAYRDPFAPLVPGFSHVPYGNIGKLETALTADTAAVILEAVQGEGGVRPADPAYLQAVRALCNEHGVLLIIDEIQSGFGRTGRWFAFQHAGITPDIVTMGKGIAGGFPMGATAIGPNVGTLPPGSHSSTFGGSPLACAAALITLDIYEEEHLIERSAEMGAYLLNRLNRIESAHIREVRGLGLMVGVEFRTRVHPLIEALTERGVLALLAGPTVLRMLPPLVISREEIDQAVDALIDALTVLDDEGGRRND